MPAHLKSRFPQIIAELQPRVAAAIKEAAEAIEEQAEINVHDAPQIGEGLIEAIHVERVGPTSYEVVAGDDDAIFYGHMLEMGTSHSAPYPFLIPALESQRARAIEIVALSLRNL